MPEYGNRDIIGQGEAYTRHVSAMTRERLHAKSDIAAELAHRDLRIEELEHAIRDACITLQNDRYDVRIDNALATLEDVVEDTG